MTRDFSKDTENILELIWEYFETEFGIDPYNTTVSRGSENTFLVELGSVGEISGERFHRFTEGVEREIDDTSYILTFDGVCVDSGTEIKIEVSESVSSS